MRNQSSESGTANDIVEKYMIIRVEISLNKKEELR